MNDPPSIHSEVEELAGWRRRLAIRVPAERARQARLRAVREFAKRARLKGFRPGRAPDHLVERQFGSEIDEQVVEDLVREGYAAGVARAGLEPIDAPRFDDVRWSPSGELEFVAEVDIRPEIELGRTTDFRIERSVRRVTDADVDRVLERLRRERAGWRSVDRAAGAGDRVTFDSVPLDGDGTPIEASRVENHRVELGADSLLPDFEVGLVGVRESDEREIDVGFPGDHPNQALRGVARRFRIAVHSVEERVLPELDDGFAQRIGEFASLGSARDHIRANLDAEFDLQRRRRVEEGLIDEIIEANAIDLPESMLERYVERMLSDPEGPMGGRVPAGRMDEVRQLLRPGAERALRRHYILNAIADREGLRATDDEVDAAIAERIDPRSTSAAEARRRLERAGELEDLRFHLTMERVFAWLRERSTIVEVEDADESP